jgi:glucose/arabinose dehydrogenase
MSSKTMITSQRIVAAAMLCLGSSQPAVAQEAGGEPIAAPTLPPGFAATVFAQGLPTPRHLAVADNGDVYVALRSGRAKFVTTDEPGGIAALRDSDGDGIADIHRVFGSPEVDTGLAIHGGRLYYSSMTAVFAVPLDGSLVPAGEPEIVVADLAESCCGHRTKPITITPEGRLFTQIGAPSNACQAEPGTPGSPGLMPCSLLEDHGGVVSFDVGARQQLAEHAGKRYSTGHRNIVALEWNSAAGALYVLMHGRDGLHQLWPARFTAAQDIELPAEELHRIDEGDDLGWPYTYFDPLRGERMVMPEYGGDGKTPDTSGRYKEPLIAFPGHWAPNDIVFYTGTLFPERYRNGAFIAFHGAVTPRRADVGGYSVVFVPMSAAGQPTGDWEIFADDFERMTTETGAVGRPSGLAVGPDGALYISDDSGGRIIRVTYSGE